MCLQSLLMLFQSQQKKIVLSNVPQTTPAKQEKTTKILPEAQSYPRRCAQLDGYRAKQNPQNF